MKNKVNLNGKMNENIRRKKKENLMNTLDRKKEKKKEKDG